MNINFTQTGWSDYTYWQTALKRNKLSGFVIQIVEYTP